ncbi:unnamed protein product [Dibothriocephalus latus]|uniref:Uncharacterized protein n=1 Tax=Dibothriocephalus latus TaxID=60516 RepID=A0A3P6SKB8_DIBLA|nr:unnamed protein product [Dibothriocephalus latus]
MMRLDTATIPPPTQLLTTDEIFVDDEPPKLDVLKAHLFAEGRLTEKAALKIINDTAAIFKGENNLIELEAPITGLHKNLMKLKLSLARQAVENIPAPKCERKPGGQAESDDDSGIQRQKFTALTSGFAPDSSTINFDDAQHIALSAASTLQCIRYASGQNEAC